MGKVEHRGGALQLMVEVEISVCGQTKKIKALIDTGAQANLLREDLFPSEIWKSSKNPLALTTVNGEILSGGRREVQTKINFHVEPEEKSEKNASNTTWSTIANFYDGAISCDAILGYGWLASKRLNVLPWRNALQLNDPPKWILVPKVSNSAPEKVDEIVTTPRPNTKKMRSKSKCENMDDDEILERQIKINQIRMMQLELTDEVDQESGELLTHPITDDETLWEAAKLLDQNSDFEPTHEDTNDGFFCTHCRAIAKENLGKICAHCRKKCGISDNEKHANRCQNCGEFFGNFYAYCGENSVQNDEKNCSHGGGNGARKSVKNRWSCDQNCACLNENNCLHCDEICVQNSEKNRWHCNGICAQNDEKNRWTCAEICAQHSKKTRWHCGPNCGQNSEKITAIVKSISYKTTKKIGQSVLVLIAKFAKFAEILVELKVPKISQILMQIPAKLVEKNVFILQKKTKTFPQILGVILSPKIPLAPP